MAAIDYGALLRVNGKFVNKNGDLFMDISDTGYVCSKAKDKNGVESDLGGNVLAGDENFFVTFYKTYFTIVSHGKIILSDFGTRFNSEIFCFPDLGLPNFKVSHLDQTKLPEMMEPILPWKEFVKEEWPETTGNEKLSELQDGRKARRRYVRNLKRYARTKGIIGWYYTQRWLAEWDHNGNHYEVIFGYGIDPQNDVWEEIRDVAYGFTEKEKEIIDRWFSGE